LSRTSTIAISTNRPTSPLTIPFLSTALGQPDRDGARFPRLSSWTGAGRLHKAASAAVDRFPVAGKIRSYAAASAGSRGKAAPPKQRALHRAPPERRPGSALAVVPALSGNTGGARCV
jgi:hypothetical protein